MNVYVCACIKCVSVYMYVGVCLCVCMGGLKCAYLFRIGAGVVTFNHTCVMSSALRYVHVCACVRVLLFPNTTVLTILLQINPTSTMSLIGTVLAEHSMLLLLKNLTIEGQKNLVATAALAMLVLNYR